MKLVAHALPLALEAELLDRVAAAKATDPLAPVLIVVPTRRLADHVAHRLVERFGALLGVSVLTHRALAERVIEQAGGKRRVVLEEDVTDTLFSMVIRRAPAGPLRDFVLEHKGAAAALRETITDLREAGIDPEAATATLSGAEAETAALYARWCGTLDELARDRGAGDDAELARAAVPAAPGFAARFSAIFHHGAYDLIGVRAELLRALDRGRELTFLLPADPLHASGSFGRERGLQIASPAVVTPLAHGHEKPLVTFFHAQGARAELRTAFYEALAVVAGGTPSHEVAIVVRALGPYASALDALFDEHRLAWHTSYTQPLRRNPVVAAALRAIAGEEEGGPRRWSEHAEAFASIAGEAAANEGLARLLQAAREVETVLGDDRRVTRGEAQAWLDARADATTIPPEGATGGGIRILDAMQARGLTFTHLNLAGMNVGVFPRIARDHPFLPDASRRLLREATGRPLPISSESPAEERLLLAMLLGSARRRIGVSWQRSDETARPSVPSLALHAIARFAGIDPDAVRLEEKARALPAHPRSRLQAWAAEPGLLDRSDEAILAALASESGSDAAMAIKERRPELSWGVDLVAATETLARTDGRYDGRIGVPVFEDGMAASAVERLGRCPMLFFFEDVLGVRAPETPPTPFTVDPRTIGSRVHKVLQLVYQRLKDEGAFAGGDLRARVDRGRTILREAWDESGDADVAARAGRLPVLSRIERDLWLRSLDAFLASDLARLAERGLAPEAFEQKLARAIPGGPPGLLVRARFDRVSTGDAIKVVSDYKTGRNLADRLGVSAMLSGKALQVPIYALMANATVELLSVGLDNDEEPAVFLGFKNHEHQQGVLETLSVAAALAAGGRFPIRPDDHCRTCHHRPACRKGHPPSELREQLAEDVRDARDCWSKSMKAPTLAAVRGGSAS